MGTLRPFWQRTVTTTPLSVMGRRYRTRLLTKGKFHEKLPIGIGDAVAQERFY